MKRIYVPLLIVVAILIAILWATLIPPEINQVVNQSIIVPVAPLVPVVDAGIPQGKNMTVTFIDVGQGDSEWIVSPSGQTMLIDAGEADAATKVEAVINHRNFINVVVATHPHSDHIGGMVTVLNAYTVGKFYDAGYPHTTTVYKNMLNTLDKNNVPYVTVKKGDTIPFDPEVKVDVLNPQEKFVDEINDNSIVLLMTYKNVSFLFAGDAGTDAEAKYAESLGHVTVIKVAHHGSSTASGEYLLAKTYPELSVISVGENSYGHPDTAVIERLMQYSAILLRTDAGGSITVTTDGEWYEVKQNGLAASR